MNVTYIKNKEQLNNFVAKIDHAQFLQSWEWGEFQSAIGNKIWRLAIEDNGEIFAAATLAKKILPIGQSYFFCPRGPVLKFLILNSHRPQDKQFLINVLNFLFVEIEKLAKREKTLFLRLEPNWKLEIGNWKLVKTINIEPSKTIVMDLNKPEEEILNAMHQKTRYNIRLAEKKGVKIKVASIDDFAIFWPLMEQTENRDGFRLHSRGYYERMIKFNLDFIKLFVAEYDDRIIAGSIVSFFGDMVTYVHGASSNEHRAVMAPYALQWQVIKTAKEQGYKYYDLFGIDENKWPGVTRFKLGFGREISEYPGTYDMVFNKFWYNIYKTVRYIHRAV